MKRLALSLLASAALATPALAGKIDDLARTCNACHGLNGVSVGPSMPSIAGLPEAFA